MSSEAVITSLQAALENIKAQLGEQGAAHVSALQQKQAAMVNAEGLHLAVLAQVAEAKAARETAEARLAVEARARLALEEAAADEEATSTAGGTAAAAGRKAKGKGKKGEGYDGGERHY